MSARTTKAANLALGAFVVAALAAGVVRAHLPEAYWPPLVVPVDQLAGHGQDVQLWPKYYPGPLPYLSITGTTWDPCFDEWGSGYVNVHRTAAIPGEEARLSANQVQFGEWEPDAVLVLLLSASASDEAQWTEAGWSTLEGPTWIWMDDVEVVWDDVGFWRTHFVWSPDIPLGTRVFVQPALWRPDGGRWHLGNVEALTFYDCRDGGD